MILTPRQFLGRSLVAAILAGTPLRGAEEAWQKMGQFEFQAAFDILSRTGKSKNRLESVGAALAVLNRQPKTAGNTADAEARLSAVTRENARDDAGLWARYFSARIEQWHRTPTQPVAAATEYRALIAEHPSHAAAQQALVKLALLSIYEPAVEPSRDAGLLAAAELLTRATDPDVAVGLHLLLGRAMLYFRKSEPDALTHLEAALRGGIANRQTRASILYSSAELALALGRRESALQHFRAFLAENQRDQRVNYVREQVAALGGGEEPAK